MEEEFAEGRKWHGEAMGQAMVEVIGGGDGSGR